jgi:hypothetical protein
VTTFPKPGRVTWTQTDDDLLRKCIEQRLSCSEAAKIVGRSANACIGRSHRLGLKFIAGAQSETARIAQKAQREPQWFSKRKSRAGQDKKPGASKRTGMTAKDRKQLDAEFRQRQKAASAGQLPASHFSRTERRVDVSEQTEGELRDSRNAYYAKPVTLSGGYRYHKGKLTREA